MTPTRFPFIPFSIIISGILLILLMLIFTNPADAPIAQSQTGYNPPPTSGTGGSYPAPTTAPAAPAAPAAPVPTATLAISITATTASFDDDPTLTVAPTTLVATPLATTTPTTTPTPSGLLSCIPGETLIIEGQGPPRAPFLITFDTRIVGGGSLDAAGHFNIPLKIGPERAGAYQVAVRVRGQPIILRRFVCNVPATTPTPTRVRR
ncbi:MAG TPA: hypothetical protein PKA05_05680 [Roseiflexaceae bacterium]|nr:hypothetical protein [Roseiflexaceae bacterium]HMP39852.1 hypothetical protein [Roseiflexaceae bacterium]